MKKFLLILSLIPLFFGCEKAETLGDSVNSGIYVNDRLVCELKSAFVGGAVSDPTQGASSRMHIYEDQFSVGPNWRDVKEKVFVSGFYFADKKYSGPGEGVNEIAIRDLSSFGDVIIPMNQGKYEGGNDKVTSVKIVRYALGNYDSKTDSYSDTEMIIKISLKDGQKISIVYAGPTPNDGYF